MLGVGASLGTIVLNLLSGYICEHIGWSVVFYLVGELDSGFWILDFGFWILDSGFWILDSKITFT